MKICWEEWGTREGEPSGLHGEGVGQTREGCPCAHIPLKTDVCQAQMED